VYLPSILFGFFGVFLLFGRIFLDFFSFPLWAILVFGHLLRFLQSFSLWVVATHPGSRDISAGTPTSADFAMTKTVSLL
jgi:hypothetical protein